MLAFGSGVRLWVHHYQFFLLAVKEELAVRRPVFDGLMTIFGFEQDFILASARGGCDVNIAHAPAIGAECDARSVRGPSRVEVIGGIESEARTGSAHNVENPDVALASVQIAYAYGHALVVRGKRRVCVIRDLADCSQFPSIAIPPDQTRRVGGGASNGSWVEASSPSMTPAVPPMIEDKISAR